MFKKIIIISVILIVLVSVVIIVLSYKKVPEEALNPVDLVYWGVWDEQDDQIDTIRAYQAQHPHIKITYKKIRYDEYEQALLEGWAKDEGPDIFSIPNTWVKKYQDKDFLEPLPPQTQIAFVTIKTKLKIKKEREVDYKTIPSLTIKDLENKFVDVVKKDVVIDDEIYGLPYSVDTLALFYNRDHLNNAHIAEPPQTWEEFIADVPKLTLQDDQGNIIQAGAALGTAENIPRSTDILSLLMIQNGTQMTDEKEKYITFTQPSPSEPNYYPGERALEFYTDFASPSREVYTWNDQMPDALEAFTQGKLSFFLGYSYQIPIIQAQGENINFGISSIPQIDLGQEKNYANYWVETVAKKSKNTNEAWNFIQFAAQKENVEKYLAKTKKPTALKSLIEAQREDFDLGVFANQTLTAKSWYHGKKPEATEDYLDEAIESVAKGLATPKEALDLAARQIQQTL